MKPFHEQGDITIYHGKAEEVLPVIESRSVALSFNDPPYFRVKREYWDRQWNSVEGFLAWLDSLCSEWKRILKPNGSLYVCASPERSYDVEGVIRKHFNLLNNIRWRKEAGWHKKADKEAIRSYLSDWESILFAEQFGADPYALKCDELRGFVFEPLRKYLRNEFDKAGVHISKANEFCGTASMAARHYFTRSQWCLPTPEHYRALREGLRKESGDDSHLSRDISDLEVEYKYLHREYEDLRREYEDLRRPFNGDIVHLDTWGYAPVKDYPGKHICEKPIQMLLDVIETSSKPGDLILDSFCGSGVVLEAAQRLGRRAIGIDVDLKWCKRSAARVGQGRFIFPVEPATQIGLGI